MKQRSYLCNECCVDLSLRPTEADIPNGVPTRVPGTKHSPDAFAVVVLAGTLLGLMALRICAFRLMIGGGALGVLRTYLPAIPGFKAAGQLVR